MLDFDRVGVLCPLMNLMPLCNRKISNVEQIDGAHWETRVTYGANVSLELVLQIACLNSARKGNASFGGESNKNPLAHSVRT